MTAVILAFPQQSSAADSLTVASHLYHPVNARVSGEFLAMGGHLQPFTSAWCAQHLPLIDAAMELLEADDVEFARRCQTMRDEYGQRAGGQLRRRGAHIADVANALVQTATRIVDQMAAHTELTECSYSTFVVFTDVFFLLHSPTTL